jgi:death-on-curing family protein
VTALASEAGIDLDEALIALWDAGVDYVTGPNDYISKGDTNRARRALGLATRRELATPEYWAAILGCDVNQFADLLGTLGVKEPYEDGHLRKRAIHRLMAEGRLRGVWPVMPELPPEPSVPHPLPKEHLVWPTVGHVCEMKYLTTPDVLSIHEALVNDFAESADPVSPPGVKNQSLLDSAVGRPRTAIGNTPKYPTVEMAAAALLHSMVSNHPFHNGNKRTALVSMIVFLDENGLFFSCNDDELFKLVLQLAQHALAKAPPHELADREVLTVAEWLRQRCRWIERGDRPVPWRRLRRILTDLGCELSQSSGVGNRMNISRTTTRKAGFFARTQVRRLETQTFYGSEGREVEKNTINKIRRDLELDEAHGVDSASFYDHAAAEPSEFISRYRKILRRLAKV